jgi:SAM-dependent methyltransferase
MEHNRLYNDLSWTWPIISPPQDYIEESAEYRDLLCKHAKIEVKTLLNLGTGGGHNDFSLKRFFQVTGVDLSPAMLALARKLNPEVAYIEGDMRTVRLDQTFDAVCIFDAINYMLTPEDLSAAFETAYAHLKPGGVFLTYVEQTPEGFVQNKTSVSGHTKGDVEIIFIENMYDPDPADTTYEVTFVYLIRRGGKQEVQIDHHVTGIFPLPIWIRLLKETGFEVVRTETTASEFEKIPTLIGIKPLD